VVYGTAAFDREQMNMAWKLKAGATAEPAEV